MKPASKFKECTRHVKSQETPLPVCIGCMLHANLLKKEIVDRRHARGMLIANSNNAMFVIYQIWHKWQMRLRIGTISPPNLKTGVLTAQAVDKIDHNTSSTTAISSTARTVSHWSNNLMKRVIYQGGYVREQATIPTIPTPVLPGCLHIQVERARCGQDGLSCKQ